ncbi:MAG TPA: TraB/GumN family protein [Caulobacteraceae bacterium]|jgi:hypothetical protein
MKSRLLTLARGTAAVAFGLALTLQGGCTTAQTAAPVVERSAQAYAQEPALWVVRDADSTIYLFGTVHLLRDSTKWRTPKIEQALAQSQELWVEIAEVGDQAASAAAMQKLVPQYGIDPARPLSSKLSPAEQARLKEVATRFGLQPAALEPMRPWLAALTLTVMSIQKAGYSGDAGVDTLLLKAFKDAGKPIKAFETVEQQIRFFATFPPEIEIQFLQSTLRDIDKGAGMMDQLSDAWAKGDMETFDRLFAGEMRAQSPELYKVLLVDRNEAWAKAIQERLQGSGVSFVAVGAGHLSGPDSVQARLKARGIGSTRQ